MSVWFDSDKQLGECGEFTVAVHYALMVKYHATFILSFIEIQQERKKYSKKTETKLSPFLRKTTPKPALVYAVINVQ